VKFAADFAFGTLYSAYPSMKYYLSAYVVGHVVLNFCVAYAATKLAIYVIKKAFSYIFPPAAETPWGDESVRAFNGPLDDLELVDGKDSIPDPAAQARDYDAEPRIKKKNQPKTRVNRYQTREFEQPSDVYIPNRWDIREAQAGVPLSNRILELSKKVLANTGTIATIIRSGDQETKASCYMTGFKGDFWLFPFHMISPGATLQVARELGARPCEIPIDEAFYKRDVFVLSSGGADLDVVCMRIPEIPSVMNAPNWAESLPKNPVALRFHPRIESGQRVVYVSISSQVKYSIGDSWNCGAREFYNESGMCGLAIIDLRSGCRFAIHVAGVPSKLESWFSAFDSAALKFAVNPAPEYASAALPARQSLVVDHIPGTGAYGLIAKENRAHANTKNEIVPIPIKSPWPVTMAPTRLAPFINEKGERVSPLSLAWDKLGQVAPYRPVEAVSVDHLWFPNTTKDVLFDHLPSWEAAVFGDGGSIKSIDPSTSVGPVLKLINATRRDLIDFEARTISPVLTRMLDEAWDRLATQPYPLWIEENLKMELRENERVALGKTRIYYVCDLVYLLVCRRAFGSWVAALESNPADSACIIGINMTSVDAAHLASRMKLWDPSYDQFTGDFERYDITIPYVALVNFAAEVNTRFPSHAHLRNRNIILCAGIQVHVANSVGFLVYGIDPSGIYLTSIIGSYVQMEGVASYMASRGVSSFHLATYSDDGWLSVPHHYGFQRKKLSEWFFARYGLVWTAADKSEDNGPVSPDQVTMLKRSFCRRDGIVYAPLPASTVHSILQYTHASEGELAREMIKSRIQSALLESIQHGEKFYEDVRAFATKLASHYGLNFSSQKYRVAQRALLEAHYGL